VPICEAIVVNHSEYLLAAAMFLGVHLSAAAQTPAPSAAIDPALQVKANAGDPAAQVAMGEHYAQAAASDDDKVQMAGDYQQAVAWYRKAADQNYIPAEMHLAALYRDGGGKIIPRDMEQAATWYRRAADQGDPTAQATLGVLYSMGQGVPHSDVDAYFWLDLAASVKGPNQEKYAANRQMIGERITADELSDVHDRVVAWKAAHPRPANTN
jgi:TPR repeat protein